MTATIKVGQSIARVESYQWASEDSRLLRFLNTLLDPLGPSGSDPNPDYHAALAAVEALGGEIISYDKTEYEEGVIY